MSLAIGGSNQNSQTSGVFVDVRDFGAKAVFGFDNTPAFQAAIDYVGSNGGGTVYIPGGGKNPNYWYLDKPVYINNNYITIQGDGENSSIIRTWGPAIMFAWHPRLWRSRSSSYIDTDTGQTIAARDANNNFIFNDRYKIDLYRFTANGDLKSGPSGVPPLDATIGQNQFFGIRPRNMVKGIFPGNYLATGGVSGWDSQKQLTFDFITYSHDTMLEGGIAGMGEWSNPDPWLMSGNTTEFHLCLALTDDTLMNKAIGRIRFAQPQTKGLHRISVQIDFAQQSIAVYVDRVQVSFTFNFDNGIPVSELFTKYNCLARWEYSDFSIGSRNRSSNRNEFNQAAPSDFSVLGVKVWPSLRYQNKSVGQAQLRIPQTDGSGNTSVPPLSDNDTLILALRTGYLAGLRLFEGTGSDLMVLTNTGARGFGMLVPIGNGQNQDALDYCQFRNFAIVGFEERQSDGITLGPYLHLDISDLSIRTGFFNSIGSLDCYVSYPLKLTNCKLLSKGNGFFGLNQSAIWAQSITFGYIGRSAIRLVGSGSTWSCGMTNDFEDYSEAFFMGFCGNSLGAGHRFENFMIDTEGTRSTPRIAYFYQQKASDVINNSLDLKLVSTGNGSGVPIIYLDDTLPYNTTVNFPGYVKIESCAFGSEGPLVRVKGRDWFGTLDACRWQCADWVVESITQPPYMTTKVKSIHRDLSAPPNFGGWTRGMHDIVIANQPEGGVASWNCDRTGMEGTSSPPLWIPGQLRYTRRKNVLSGNIFANFYADVSAKHPLLPTSMTKYGTLIDYFSLLLLNTILNRGTNIPRDKFCIIIDPFLTHRGMFIPSGTRRSAILDNNVGLWNAASNGIKTNKVDIIVPDRQGNEIWPCNLRTRSASFFMNLGNSNWDPHTVLSAASGRFVAQNQVFFNKDSITIPAGSLKFGLAPRDGSWSIYAMNQFLDYLFGNASLNLPSMFYIGLSRTPVSTNGTGVTETIGGNYTRVPVALGSNNFALHDEFGSTWSNTISINFPAPTSDWGDFEWFFISDSANGGNIWASGPLNRAVSIKSGDTAPSFMPLGLQIQL